MNIIQGFPTPQKDFYKVLVRSYTYNQAIYIEDCLKGVAMQHTNFPVVHIVVDDASTDGEQDVIKSWIEKSCDLDKIEHYENDICTIILAKAKDNPNYTIATYLLKKNLNKEKERKREYLTPWRKVCQYEALCEGDDYWIDSKKLQKQADALDAHIELDMCSCGTIYIKEGKEIKRLCHGDNIRILTMEETIKGGGSFLGTCSLMFRTTLIMDTIYTFWKYMSNDYIWQMCGALRGGIIYLPDYMAAYRVASAGSWSVYMKHNYKAIIEHTLRKITVLQLLDKETDYNYSKDINEVVSNLSFDLMLNSFYSKAYAPIFSKLTCKRKLKFFYYVLRNLL